MFVKKSSVKGFVLALIIATVITIGAMSTGGLISPSAEAQRVARPNGTKDFSQVGGTINYTAIGDSLAFGTGAAVPATGVYTAGPTANVTDTVRVTDASSAFAETTVSVVPQDTVCPLGQKVWDGGGATNNWSEALNWCGNVAPISTDNVVFNGTSIKDSIVNQAFVVSSLSVNTGYTGTITQSADLSVGIAGFVHNAGVFNAGGLLQLQGNLTVGASATFVAGTGTLVFNGVGNNQALSLPASLTVNNLTVNKSHTNVLFFNTGSTNLIIAGTLTLTDGGLQDNTNVSTFNAQGPVSIAPTFDGGTGPLLISGTEPRTITLPAGASIPRTTVNAANVTLDTSGAGTITFDRAFDVTNCASFTNGSVNFVFTQAFTYTAGTNFTPGSGNVTFGADYTQTGGTFSPGTGSLNFNSNVAITGGTFNAPSGILQLQGNLTVGASATFVAGTGTLVFNGVGNNQALSLPASLTVNNLTVNKSHTNVLFFNTGSTNLIIAGTLTLTDGGLQDNTNVSTFNAQGSIAVASTFDGGIAGLTISGAANQTYTNAGGVNPGGTWTINKAGGVFALANDLMLGTTQALNITSGEFSQGASSDLRAGAVTVGASGLWRNNGTGDITLGGNVTNAGEIDIDGTSVSCDEADSILIRSSSLGVQRSWSGAGSFFFQDADLQDQIAGVPITVHAGTDGGNNANWTFDAQCAPFVWDGGGVTNNWSEAANWRRNLTPPAATTVIFDGTSVKDAVVDSDVTVDGVRIDGDYSGTISWSDLANHLTVGSNGFTQSGGSIVPGRMTVNGDISISSGVFQVILASVLDGNGNFSAANANLGFAPDAATSISGDVTIGPNFSFSTGSHLILDGNTPATFSVPANTQFNNLTIDKTSNATVTIEPAANIIVNGQLALTRGVLNGFGFEVRGPLSVGGEFAGGTGSVTIQNAPPATSGTISDGAVLPEFFTLNSADYELEVADLNGTVSFQNFNLSNGRVIAGSTLSSTVVFNGAYLQNGGEFFYGSDIGQSLVFNNSFTLFNGTFRPLLATSVDMNGDVVLSAGTFTANSGNLNIATNFSRSSGNTFNRNGGTVIFDGAPGEIYSIDLPIAPNTTVFNNVLFNGANQRTLASGVSTFTAFIAEGSLEFNDGFVVSSPAHSTMEARGDVLIGNGFDNGVFTSIRFGGAADQSFSDNGGFESFDFTLDKSGGTVNLLSDLDLAAALNTQTLDLANGTITTGASKVIIGADDTLVNGDGFVIGDLEQQFVTDGSVLFNVGTSSGPSPVNAEVSSAGPDPFLGVASLTISATQGNRIGMRPTMSVGRFWTIESTGSIVADLTFFYPQEDANGDESQYELIRWSGNNATNIPGILDTVANTYFTAGVSEFSDWAIGVLVPTSASVTVSGRVMRADGQGIPRALVTFTDSSGSVRTALTS